MNFSQDITSWLDSATFIKQVRPLCVITQGADSFIADTDLIFQGVQLYNTVGLVLGAAKNLDNTPLFSTPTIYDGVLNLMTNSVYSYGIQQIVAELTAANIIRSLPVDSSTGLKLLERGRELETRAYSNLDRIIHLYSVTTSSSTASSAASLPVFNFAPDID